MLRILRTTSAWGRQRLVHSSAALFQTIEGDGAKPFQGGHRRYDRNDRKSNDRSYGDNSNRESYSDRNSRGSYGDRGNRNYGDRNDRSYGDRNNRGNYGDRENRGNYGDRRGRGGNDRGRYDRGSGRGRGNGRSYGRGNDHGQDQDFARNISKGYGPEGDGLKGLEDYAVLPQDELMALTWTDLQQADAEELSGFSSVTTLGLASHKLLSRVLVNSLHYHRGYTRLTPVQAQTLLPILQGKSAVVRAKTGTGKTAAFAVPVLQHVLEAKRKGIEGVKAVIVSPTRELAQQISDEISAITGYGELRTIRTMCFVGGLSKQAQIKNGLSNRTTVDLAVVTPGRLFDLLSEPEVAPQFANVQVKILDEADRLLDIGFKDTLGRIDEILKAVRATDAGDMQTLLFSATTDRNMMQFAEQELGDRGKVEVVNTVSKDEPEAQELVAQDSLLCNDFSEMYMAAAESVYSDSQIALDDKSADRTAAQDIDHETEKPAGKTADTVCFKSIVFLPTIALVNHFTNTLKRYVQQREADAKTPRSRAMSVSQIHGKLTQGQRQRVADSFRKTTNGVLVTTDVIARGMDFPGVTHVFQMGVPQDVASYIHRIGRTARIGHTGKSLLLHTPHEAGFLKLLQAKNIVMEHRRPYAVSDTTVELISRLAPAVLDEGENEAQQVYTSLFAAFEPVRRMLGIDGRDFLQDQNAFARLLELDQPRLPVSLRESYGRRAHNNKMGTRRGGPKKATRRY